MPGGVSSLIRPLGQTSDAHSNASGASLIARIGYLNDHLNTLAPVTGNPYVNTVTLTSAATDYPAVINGTLTRNAHRGVRRADGANGGMVEIRFSSNGTTFSEYFKGILAGETFDLEGLDIHTLGFKSTSAGDKVYVLAF
jgi:hypothetical protein